MHNFIPSFFVNTPFNLPFLTYFELFFCKNKTNLKSLFHKALEMSCTAGMAKLAQRLCLDLTDTLTSDIEFLSDLLEGTRSAIVETETQLNNMLLSGSEGMQLFFKLLTQDIGGSCLRGRGKIGRAHV